MVKHFMTESHTTHLIARYVDVLHHKEHTD